MNVSVVVPTYKDLNFLKKSLPNILNQNTKIEYEVIIVNDGNTVETKDYLQKLLLTNKHKYITAIHLPKNKGVCYARNKGITEAIGKIVVNMDADCVPSKTWLKELVEPFKDKKIGVVSSYGAFGGTSTAFRKTALNKVGLYDEQFGYYREDTDLTFRLIEAGYLFKKIPQNFVHSHPEQIPKGLKGLISYGLKRILLHQNDVLLWKKHNNKMCKKFLRMKNDWLVDPWWDFSVATGLWGEGGKMGLSSPRFNSPYNAKSVVFVKCDGFQSFFLTVLGGLGWMVAVKFGRLVGSIRFGVWLV